MAILSTMATMAAGSRRGVVVARLGTRRVLVQVGEDSLQATADGTVRLGDEVLLLEWPGGVTAAPLQSMGLAPREEVICDHG